MRSDRRDPLQQFLLGCGLAIGMTATFGPPITWALQRAEASIERENVRNQENFVGFRTAAGEQLR
ncbi:hypothetical protein GTW51_10185 [Aurantimonas aggregata]|uniref:Uncharacterized protein n=1 Tax=Aurantimonas aggregata TaxID=2047720 RepID=A0A6L9MHX3_9HYPH|nr:hypothetical protein [Aurantimonas aggregata]NDV87070.1 hypothetical protein [Aurantimonas aggregata]